MKIIFAGTPAFSVPALQTLCAAGHTITCVLTQPDRPAGRGRKLQPSPVKIEALNRGLTVLQPTTLRTPQALSQLEPFAADLMVVVAYGLILPEAILSFPARGCLNIHASLLPRWRGAAPIHRVIEAGDTQTGITIMQMDATLDTGDILLMEPMAIRDTDTSGILHDRLADLGAKSIVHAVHKLEKGSLTATRQDHQQATYAHKLEKKESVLDWSLPATALDRKIRAFNPWPIAQSTLNHTAWRIWSATPVPALSQQDFVSKPGTILACNNDGLRVATGQDDLLLTQLQRPGGKPLAVAQLLNSYSFQPGERFETSF